MSSTFRCVLAIRTRKLFDKDVYYANVPGEDGLYGVLRGHEMLVALNRQNGIATFSLDEQGNEKEQYLVYGGATQMFNGILTILGEFAVEANSIDREAVEADKAEAEKRIGALVDEGEDKLSTQDKSRLAVYRHRLSWDNYQLEYLDKKK